MRRVRSMFRGNQTQRVELDLGDVIDDVVRLVTREAVEREVAVRVDVQRALPKIVGDQILLQQCVLNLLMNALDACVCGKRDQKIVTIAIARDGSSLMSVKIADNGSGIDKSIADRLFEPFVTTKGNGLGLGLLVARSIVEQHGGKISCESNHDGGATFTLTLPIAESKSNRSRLSRRRGNRRMR
jgi:C4-dicarboxylate-specific signal transduction histidine kinase